MSQVVCVLEFFDEDVQEFRKRYDLSESMSDAKVLAYGARQYSLGNDPYAPEGITQWRVDGIEYNIEP